MPRVPSDRLYVNLSASQTRKRLKGYGFGVKKIEAAGRNQAAILHTATGSHLRELRALFADVLAHSPDDVPVENLRNIGTASARWLKEVGVTTQAELARLGAASVFRLVRQRQPEASFHLLWALAGALSDRDWRDLSDAEQQRLRQQVDELNAH